MSEMAPLDMLLAIEGVKRAKAEYFRCVDGQHWNDLRAVFTPNPVVDMRESVQPHNPSLLHHDAAEFVGGVAYVLEGVTTAHFGYMPRIDILSPTEAQAVWSMEDWLWIPEGHAILPPGRMHGWGHYEDRYVKQGDRWLISASRLTRIKLEHR
ncbi:nuclear transport factor 2 family protein [Sphingomonas jatrophae]|uniref:SnoaL-like domain-containing protein n=1 Tax=Sphingomonas jatrophae TaxID=1166337 RepID=A0A1I6KIF4_9SPHN|nr:nuclear transport factor 2 family protein [Sphingomonas jatrophae]SFR90991.1 SnoaL-like domain-containing protein [Sphingomonas jatrophae]